MTFVRSLVVDPEFAEKNENTEKQRETTKYLKLKNKF